MFVKCLLIILICGVVFADLDRKLEKRSLSHSCKDGNCDQSFSNPLSEEIKFWNQMLDRLHQNRNKLVHIIYRKKKELEKLK